MNTAVSSVGQRRDEIHISLNPGRLGASVLSQVVGSVAGRADLSVDRISDAVLIADALGAPNRHGRLDVTAVASSGALELRVGPLPPGEARRLLDEGHLPGVGAVVDRLADEVTVQISDGRDEVLMIRVGSATS